MTQCILRAAPTQTHSPDMWCKCMVNSVSCTNIGFTYCASVNTDLINSDRVTAAFWFPVDNSVTFWVYCRHKLIVVFSSQDLFTLYESHGNSLNLVMQSEKRKKIKWNLQNSKEDKNHCIMFARSVFQMQFQHITRLYLEEREREEGER